MGRAVVVAVALRLCFFVHAGQRREEGQRLMGWGGLRSVDHRRVS